MCGFCCAVDAKRLCGDPGFGSVSAPLQAAFDVGDDATGYAAFTIPGDTSTTATIGVDTSVTGTLETVTDQDWYRIELSAGQTIKIDLEGYDFEESPFGSLLDPYLRVYDADGAFIAANDDIVLGVDVNSRLVFTAPSTGTYYLEVDSWRSATSVYYPGYTGDYRLTVTNEGQFQVQTPLDAISGGLSVNDDDTVLVYFARPGDFYASGIAVYEATGLTAFERAQFEEIFNNVSTFADVNFAFTDDPALRSAADLEVATASLDQTGNLLGFFYYPTQTGVGSFGVLNNNSAVAPYWNDGPGGTFDRGGFMYGVAIHEVGHGLGLGHPHDMGGGSEIMFGVGNANSLGTSSLNAAVFTAMSYNDGWHGHPNGVASSSAATGHIATFSPLDIAALQQLYGTNTSHAAGDDVYALDDSNAVGSGAGYYATWDTGGVDAFHYSGARDAVIDLRAATLAYEAGGGGFVSHVDGVIGGRTIANGVSIENAASGSGDDLLHGNSLANALRAGAGADTVIGAAGDDHLWGGLGDDTLSGGAGADLFVFAFGDGHDVIDDFDPVADRLGLSGLGIDFDNLTLLDGTEGVTVTYAHGVASTVYLKGVSAAALSHANVLGDAGAMTTGTPLVGTSAADNLAGSGEGEDLRGLDGADVLFGRAGGDAIYGGSEPDSVSAGIGSDYVNGGSGDDQLLGQGDRDTLSGEAGSDTLRGGSGDDILMGGDNEDLLYGQGNNDWLDGGDGDDLLIAAAGLDTLNGGAGNDTLRGGNGADRLDGGFGNDVLNGGAHRDIIVFSVGGGSDTVAGFQHGLDRLHIDKALIGDRSIAAMMDELAHVSGTSTVVQFEGGETLRVASILPDKLMSDIDLF